MIGAGSAIAGAAVSAILDDPDDLRVVTVSRSVQAARPGVSHLVCDNSVEDIERVVEALQGLQGRLRRVIIAQGMLHSETIMPEKRLEELDAAVLHQLFDVNAVGPMMWVSRLLPLLRGDSDCVLTVFSARVGSISDNRKGGWYSYRASKAALNMLMKTAAIEYARRASNVKLMAFHPGTVDTPLSRPFQRRVPENRLFTPEYVARRLLEHMDAALMDGELSFIDWDGRPVSW